MSSDVSSKNPASAKLSSPARGATTAWASWLRVFAITGVIAIHTVGPTAAAEGARDTLRGQLAILLDFGGIFAVPVFIMISGAFLLDPQKYNGPALFLRKRTLRIVPPLLFWNAWYVGILIFWLDKTITFDQLVMRFLNGNIYSALYFFWIVLGLSVLAPILIPFFATATRRQAIIAGIIGASVPVVAIGTRGLRGTNLVFMDFAWTWWIPYVGVFILGWALRGVVLRGRKLALVAAMTIFLGLEIAWQWRNESAPSLLDTISPVSYYGPGVILYSCGVFLTFQGLIRADGLLRSLTRPRSVRIGTLLGDATLGVFGLHHTILLLSYEMPFIGGDAATGRTLELLGRVAFVWVVTYAIVLVLRRVPLVKRVL